MAFPPVPVAATSNKDNDHLLILSIFHFILAGFSFLGIGFLMLHYTVMSTVFANPRIWQNMKDNNGNPVQPPFDPVQLFDVVRWVYLFIGLWAVASIILNLAAGFRLRQWRSRTFLLFVSAFNCINFFLGTVLGVFTIVVLTRDSVRTRFESGPATIGI